MNASAALPAERFTAGFGLAFGALLCVLAPGVPAVLALVANAVLAMAALEVFPRLRAARWSGVRFGALLLPAGASYVFYKECGLVLHRVGVRWRDWDLEALAPWLTEPMAAGAGTLVTEWMAFSYVVYAPLVVVSAWLLARRGDRVTEPARMIHALCVLLGVCYVWFVAYPVLGPRHVDPFFQLGRMGQGVFSAIAQANQAHGMLVGAAFPSAHVAGAIVLVVPHLFRRTFWLLAPIVFTIPISTVYFGYHYAADAVAGVLVGVAVCVAMGYTRDTARQTAIVFRRVVRATGALRPALSRPGRLRGRGP